MNSKQSAESTVSVVIPAYNSETSLARSIDSALRQTLPPHEIIVINDGSTDRTAELAQSYGDRVIYLEQENLGQGAARNTGLRVATGRFIAFLDSDDYWREEFLNTCVDFLLLHEKAIAVSTGIIVRLWGKPERRWPLENQTNDNGELKAGVLDNFFDFWGRHDHVRTGSNVIRREAIDRAGFQRADLRISQDLEYWGYLATWGKWGFIPDHLWIGDPAPSAAPQGCLNKYHKRRSLCPTIDQWQSRIIPRLAPEHRKGFEQVRGRVAANFALSKIKSGAANKAWGIVKQYGKDMPANWSTYLMRAGCMLGVVGRKLAAEVIKGRERYKSQRMINSARWPGQEQKVVPPFESLQSSEALLRLKH